MPHPPRRARRSCGHRAARGCTVAGSSVATSRPRSITVQRVGQADQLVEVGGDQQDAHPFGAGVLEQLPDRRLRADVDAAGRVGGDQQPRVADSISRPTISFCWLPPESATAERVRPGGADVVLLA